MKKTMSRKKQQRLLHALCAGTLFASSVGTVLPAQAATITESQTYHQGDFPNAETTLDNTYELTSGSIVYNANTGLEKDSTLTLTGDITITNTSKTSNPYALASLPSWSSTSNSSRTLAINPDSNATVKIVGDLKVGHYAGPHDDPGYYDCGRITANFANDDSYLAGIPIFDTSALKAGVDLTFSNGATWYVTNPNNAGTQPGYDFTISDGTIRPYFQLRLNGGIVDLYHTDAAGSTRTLSANLPTRLAIYNVNSSANGATFVVATDVASSTSYSGVILTGSGGNTYTIRDDYDASESSTGTYTGQALVLTTTGSATADTVKAADSTTVKNGGLTTRTRQITLSSTIAAGDMRWNYYITSVKVTSNESGPAQVMAEAGKSTAAAATSAWRAENNELLRRMGDLRGHSEDAGAWLRTYGGESEVRSGGSASLSYLGVQGGYDWDRRWQGGRLFTGIAVSHLHGTSSFANGSGTMDSNLFGIYGSYIGDKGHYADLILKYGHVGSDFGASGNGSVFSGSTGRNGLSASFEYGRRQQLAGGRYFEPQAELTYSHLGSANYIMTMDGATGARVHEDGVNSLVGRIGGTYGIETKDGNVYAKLGLLHEFSGSGIVNTAYGSYSSRAESSMRDTWLEYGLGFNARVAKNAQVYGEFVKTAGASKIINKWMLNAGFRLSF